MHHLTRFSLAHPRIVLAILAIVTIVLGLGLPRLRTEFGYRVLIGDEHPAIQTLDDFIGAFGGGLPAQVVWACGPDSPCDSVFDLESVEMAHALSMRLRSLDVVKDVIGVSNAPVLVPTPHGFSVRRFVENGHAVPDAAELTTHALNDRFWVQTVVSADARVGALTIQPWDNKGKTDIRLVGYLEDALAEFEDLGFEFYLVGDAPAGVVSGRELAKSTANLIPITIAVIGAVLLALTRSWKSALVSLATMGVALLWTFGLLGWMDWPQDGILEVLAPLILVVGVCDAIHLLSARPSAVGEWSREGEHSPIERAAIDVGPACLLTTLTTAAALLSFASSQLETFVRFGLISAFGVVSCLILTFSLLPIFDSRLPASRAGAIRIGKAWNSGLESLLRVTEERAVSILAISIVLLVGGGLAWWSQLRVDTNFFEMFGEKSRVIRWIRFVEDNFRPSDNLEVKISLDALSPIEDPETLQSISDFAGFLSGLDGLGRSTSVVDLIARVNRLLHGDNPEFERPADSKAGNAEILELLALEDADLLGRWLSLDRSDARISVMGPEQPYSSRGEVLHLAREYISTGLPSAWDVSLTGEMAIQADWMHDVQGTQLRSFPAAFLLVLVLAGAFLRSPTMAFAALIPTLIPVVLILGAMGWLDMTLDVGRAMVGAIVIGIGVDDAIHLLSRYRSLRSSGASSVAAMRSAVAHVGRAIVTTSVALALGFLTLMASAWQTISSFGFFVALAILGALAATLFVLPALIFAFAGGEGSQGRGEEVSPRVVSPPRRQFLALLALLPVVGAVGGTAVVAVRPGAAMDLACWVLPNARVMPLPGSGSCPLAPEDSIRKIRGADGEVIAWSGLAAFHSIAASAQSDLEVGVQSRGEDRWVGIPVEHRSRLSRLLNVSSAGLAAMALLSIPLFLVWHSTSAAAAPLLFFFAAVATITVVAMSGSASEWLTVAAVAAMVVIPATVVHLNLTLLRGRSLIRDAPGFVLVPYGLMSILLPAGWFALQRDPLLWPPFIYLIILLTGGAAGSLLVSCGYAIRESPSPIERARARVLLYGALLLPLLPTFFLARNSASVSEAIGTYLWTAAVMVQLPIGLAISRDNLFDLGDQLRRLIARAVYFAAGAAVVTVAFEATRRLGAGGGLVLFFAAALACMVGVEAIRERLIGYLQARVSPRGAALSRVGQGFFTQISELREPAEVATLLGQTLEEALRPGASCVFLGSGTAWHPVFVSGEQPPAQISLAEDACTVLTGRRSAQLLEALEAPDLPTRELGEAGVELLLSLERDGVLLGMVLLSPSQRSSPYTGTEVRFASSVAEQTSLALHNARLASDLVSAELQAGTARVALTLVHQLGKELDWIRGLAKHLPSRLSDPAKAERDAKRIRDLSDDVARRARGFLEDASAGARRQPGTRSLDAVLDHSIQLVSERFGSRRVTQTIAPGLDWARVEDSVESVLLNLLDNALRASPPDAPVHVLVTQEADWLQIRVSDRGCGMSPDVLARSFEFGFSARTDGGGHGLGLAVSKETVEGLGGSLEIESEEGSGTRATLRLPVMERSHAS